jgi:nicotinamidase-related amidase
VPLNDAALVVIDVQEGFNDPSWGPRNNPDCEANVAALVRAWTEAGLPVVLVHHDSTTDGSPLEAGSDGNRYKAFLDGVTPALSIAKHVHSAFYGDPSLEGWLQSEGITSVAVCGITTDHCCETTVRMAGDLGYDTYFVVDATHTFDRVHPDGTCVRADDIARASAAKIHNEFATVTSTAEAVGAVAGPGRPDS